VLNSLSTLRQYFWPHCRQCDCLYSSKHSHSIYPGTWSATLIEKSNKTTHRTNQEKSVSCSLSTYRRYVSRQNRQLHCLIGLETSEMLTKSTQNTCTKKMPPSTASHLHPSKSTVNVVFTFNASAICAAPSPPMLLPVCFRGGGRKVNFG